MSKIPEPPSNFNEPDMSKIPEPPSNFGDNSTSSDGADTSSSDNGGSSDFFFDPWNTEAAKSSREEASAFGSLYGGDGPIFR